MAQTRRHQGSIRRRIALSFVLIVLSMVAITAIMNIFFLDDFYQNCKENRMHDTFERLYGASQDGSLYSENYSDTFERLCANQNLSIAVSEPDGNIILSSSNRGDEVLGRLFDSLFDVRNNRDSVVLHEAKNYTLTKEKDQRFNEDYLVLVGTLYDGNTVMIRSAMESIHEAASISNEFLLVAGLFAVILAAIVGLILTRMISKPITKLTELSTQMSNLDFDVKYEPSPRNDELDVLGEHMNDLSEKLQTTIAELKQANLDMQKDIENRDASEKMRREFLSNVSHELKTPIAVIQGYAEGLQDGIADNPEDLKFYTDTIIDESKRMNIMVRQMLALNQLEYGENTVSMERFDVTATVQSVIDSQKVLADNDGIRIEFENADTPEYAWADEFMTEQVVSNYLSNAIHYCDGEKVIRIWYTIQNDVLRISVFNTGSQIPEDSIPHLWEKFYKVDKARTREYGGSGIGLSVVKAIMDAFHQQCGVINHEDGVEFWFELDRQDS